MACLCWLSCHLKCNYQLKAFLYLFLVETTSNEKFLCVKKQVHPLWCIKLFHDWMQIDASVVSCGCVYNQSAMLTRAWHAQRDFSRQVMWLYHHSPYHWFRARAWSERWNYILALNIRYTICIDWSDHKLSTTYCFIINKIDKMWTRLNEIRLYATFNKTPVASVGWWPGTGFHFIQNNTRTLN